MLPAQKVFYIYLLFFYELVRYLGNTHPSQNTLNFFRECFSPSFYSIMSKNLSASIVYIVVNLSAVA